LLSSDVEYVDGTEALVRALNPKPQPWLAQIRHFPSPGPISALPFRRCFAES
jgi:hypothetical protein